MVFSSVEFLTLFLPAVILGSLIFQKRAQRASRNSCPSGEKTRYTLLGNLWLLLASLLFYAYGEPRWIVGFLAQILLNYAGGLLIGKYRERAGLKKALLSVFILLDLGVLIYFKYLNLLGKTVLGLLGEEWQFSIVMPIGISFYSFQIISYLIDVYRGQVAAQKNPLDFILYVSMFPQLVAGPIVRYRDVAAELRHRNISIHDFCDGAKRFILGLSKKVLIANQLALFADLAFGYDIIYLGQGQAWLGAICYALQIYFDFSGYSDMALGIGRMLGFHFMENFNYPYLAESIREFWRRWHISLSLFFRDYVYIPLGGSKGGRWKTYRNLLIVFALCGFWHGASWNFLCWGLYYGLFLIFERTGIYAKTIQKFPVPLRHLYTLLAVLFGWVLFRAEDLAHAAAYWGVMAGLGAGQTAVDLFAYVPSLKVALFLCVGVLCSFPCGKFLRGMKWEMAAVIVSDMAALCLLVLCMVELSSSGYNPFIYFRF